ncbi:MAG: hypothetical protein M1829_005779 [Trizodia sp. TS-e1964]|nr:MAG: hypothetical protein M1829_005779 [Trizodia sp. TS-e1964]
MSLPVAIQSVVYYVASCSSIRKVAGRRNQRREAARQKDEKARMELEHPELYRHPSPFSTNKFWGEEMALGPGPPNRNKAKDRSGSQRALNTSGTGSSLSSSVGVALSPRELQLPEDARLTEVGWNTRRYQREDEELWGHDANNPGRGAYNSLAGSANGLTIRSRNFSNATQNYFVARNPPVNELHPPVVSSPPRCQSEMKWMLQPPPSAKIMEGKIRVTSSRGRSGSGPSKKSSTETKFGRQSGEKLSEERARKGDKARNPSSASRNYSKGKVREDRGWPIQSRQAHESLDWSSSGSLSSTPTRSKRRLRPISISEDRSSSRNVAIHIPMRSDSSVSSVLEIRQASVKPSFQKPAPSTASKSQIQMLVESQPKPSNSLENTLQCTTSKPDSLPPLGKSDVSPVNVASGKASCKILQEISSSNTGPHSRRTSLHLTTKVATPSNAAQNSDELSIVSLSDFRVPAPNPQNMHENSRCLPTQGRWSMDI